MHQLLFELLQSSTFVLNLVSLFFHISVIKILFLWRQLFGALFTVD